MTHTTGTTITATPAATGQLAHWSADFGDAYTEGDEAAITEAGWHIERYLQLSLYPEDQFEAKYVNVEYKDGTAREGIGMICRQTSAAWVPTGHIVFAIVAEYDPLQKRWHPARNPR